MNKPSKIFKDTRELVTNRNSQIHWVRLLIAAAGLLALSFVLSRLFNFANERLNLTTLQFELVALISVFVTSFLANVTIIMPVPFAVIFMMKAAEHYNPLLVTLCGAVGGTLGEISGYYAGRLGRKIVIPDSIMSHSRVEGWIGKYGMWAIGVIAFQPIIPFDVGGILAGAARMPLYKFLPALFVGKFLKYLLLVWLWIFLGAAQFFPQWLKFLMGL